MGYAYDCLSDQEKANIKTIAVEYSENVIEIKLRTLDNWRRFTYTTVFEGVTQVVDVSEKLEVEEINESFEDVASEDIHLLVVNQESILEWFAVTPRTPYYNGYEEGLVDPPGTIAKIFEKLRESMESRSFPLGVLWATFSPTRVSEGMTIIDHLDPLILSKTFFTFELRNEPVSMEDLVHDWNEKELDITVNELTRENLEELEKVATMSPSYSEIDVRFTTCNQPDITGFFDPELFHISVNNNILSIVPKTRRFSSLPIQRIESDLQLLAADLEQLFDVDEPLISEPLGLKVLANSVVMEKVLKNLQCFDIQNLRKVSIGVRDCIDDVKPEPHIKKYDVRLCGRWVFTRIDLESGDYRRMNSLDQEVALNDFKINLMHQKVHLEKLQIAFESDAKEFGTHLGEVLQRRKNALKVETLSFGSATQKDMMQMLPYLDKGSLKNITILNISYRKVNMNVTYFTHLFNIDEIAKTEQWKSASQLLIEQSTVTTPIPNMNITHFAIVEIQVHTMSSDDVGYLKTELLKSTTLQKFKIKFKASTIDETLHGLLGQTHRTIPDVKKIWYFRMPNPDYYLHIVLDTHDRRDEFRQPVLKLLVLSKVKKEDTPFFE